MKAVASVGSAGRQAAVKWLKSQRGDDELPRIEEKIADIFANDDTEHAFFLNDIDAYTAAERLYMILADTDREDFDRDVAAEFWGSLCDDDQPDVDFVYGFAQGIID